MSDQRLTKADRLLGRGAFERVYRRRRRASDAVLLVYVCQNESPYTRLGMSVSRRVGDAVVRNRWKRAIREAFRTSRDELPVGVDVVVSPSPPGKIKRAPLSTTERPCPPGPPPLDQLRRSLIELACRAAGRLNIPKQ